MHRTSLPPAVLQKARARAQAREGIERLQLELRIAGVAALAPAVVAPVLAGIVVLVAALAHARPSVMSNLAVGVVEGACPLGVAVAVAGLVGRDRAIEIVLATPRAYSRVLGIRLVAVLGCGALPTFLVAFGAAFAGWWPASLGAWGVVGVWAPPMIWLSAAGALGAAAFASPAAGSGLVGAIWLVQLVLPGLFLAHPVLAQQYLFATARHLVGPAWVADRLGLLAGAGVLSLVGLALLCRPERLGRADA